MNIFPVVYTSIEIFVKIFCITYTSGKTNDEPEYNAALVESNGRIYCAIPVDHDATHPIENILKAYDNLFGLDARELNYALTGFFGPDVPATARAGMVSKVEQSLKGKEELFKKLKQVITGTAVLNPYWGEEGDQKKKNHFPAVYNQYRLPFLFEAINAGYLKQIEE